MPSDLVNLSGYYFYFNVAVKKGYSGVAVYSQKKPSRIRYKLGMKRFDKEEMDSILRNLNLTYKKAKAPGFIEKELSEIKKYFRSQYNKILTEKEIEYSREGIESGL